MKKLLLTLTLSLCAWSTFAGEAIVTTVIARASLGTNDNGGTPLFVWLPVTNVVDIPNGQAARVAMLRDAGLDYGVFVWVEKSGLRWPLISHEPFQGQLPLSRGEVIQGPARFVVISHTLVTAAGELSRGEPLPPPFPTLLTLERWTVRKAGPAQLAQ